MRKIFTFLFAALMSVGMYATTEVTITQADFPQHGKSFTKDGVTVSAGMIDGMDGNIMQGGSFSTTLGNFTKIEVTAMSVSMLSGEGWSGNTQKKTWTGNASSVSFSGDIMGMGMGTTTLKFTIEEPTVAVTGVTLNQSEAQMTVGGETLTLTATVLPNNATNKSVMWSSDNGYVATVDNGVVTAEGEGTATITVTTVDGEYTATCAVTVTAPEPQPATTVVTITDSDFPAWGKSCTKDGVTVSAEMIDGMYGNIGGPGSFSTTLGNFTQIEVNAMDVNISGEGWSGNSEKMTWTGNASSVSFTGDINGDEEGVTLKFTIEPASTPEPEPEPEPEPQPVTTYTVTFTDINSNVKVVENITLPHTFSCDYTNGNGELDLIIQEFYNEPGGHCATNGWPWGGNDNEVVVGHDGNNHFVTINAPFIGTSFMSGYYDGINDGNFYYTFHITIAASASEPEPQPVTDPITPYEDPQDASVYYSTFYDSNFKYELPTGVEAYVADLSGANLLLTKIAEAGEVIPADNAVILKSSVTPVILTQSDAAAVTFTATNDLQGSDTQIATPANCYVLAGTDGVVGFYHYTADNLNAHKAYVVYAGSNQAPRRMPFIFDQATGVESIQHSAVSSQKFIENGVLYIIKNGVKYNAMGQEVK